MNRMCVAYGKAPTGDIRSAYIVYERSKIVGKHAARAKPGDFHFWAIAGRANGHVGLDVLGGGHTVFMATNSVTTKLGAGIGFMSVKGYVDAKAGRAVYLGFSRGYANGDVTSTTKKHCVKPVVKPAVAAKPKPVVVKPKPKPKPTPPATVYVTEGPQGLKYKVIAKRAVGQAEWTRLRAAEAAGNAKVVIVTLSKSDLAAITGK